MDISGIMPTEKDVIYMLAQVFMYVGVMHIITAVLVAIYRFCKKIKKRSFKEVVLYGGILCGLSLILQFSTGYRISYVPISMAVLVAMFLTLCSLPFLAN